MEIFQEMISKLFVKPIKGKPPVSTGKINLIADKGVEGDCHALGGDRAVCLVTEKTSEELNSISEKYNCIEKFSPNIVLSSDITFSEGDKIIVNSVQLNVTKVGRECHQLCALPDCPLIKGIIFASVEKGGIICIGDTEEYA